MTFSHTNARSGNVKWTLRVALDRESYHAGDILQANVFLCVLEPVHCNGIAGFVRGEEKVTWSEKTARRAIGEEVYNQQNEFLNNKMIVAQPRMYGPGEYLFPVVYQLHSALPASFQLKCHPDGFTNGVHARLGYVFLVCLNASQGVLLEAQQEIVIQEAALSTRAPALGFEVVVPTHGVQLAATSGERLSATLDRVAYRSRETIRVRCHLPNERSGGGESFTVIVRLFEDMSVAVAPAKQGKCSRLLCERSYQVAAADAPAFELALDLASGPSGGALVERSLCASFVNRRHRLTVESFPPSCNGVVRAELVVVIV